MTKKDARPPAPAVEDLAPVGPSAPDHQTSKTSPEQTEEQPTPKPGDPGFDWSTEYGTDELFHYTLPNGKVVALKPFGAIFSKTWLFKIRNLKTNVDVELAALDRGSCDAAKELLEELDDTGDGDPIAELWDAWTGTSDGDEGLTSGN